MLIKDAFLKVYMNSTLEKTSADAFKKAKEINALLEDKDPLYQIGYAGFIIGYLTQRNAELKE